MKVLVPGVKIFYDQIRIIILVCDEINTRSLGSWFTIHRSVLSWYESISNIKYSGSSLLESHQGHWYS